MNFDRVADIYDATRGLPEDVAERAVDAIVAATNATRETRFLELGVGTGRIAIPLAQRGYPYTGVDISRKMMEQLRQKASLPNLTLVEADVTDLPFPDGSFDVVLAVHVLHLVPEWRKALAEAKRVTAAGGYFLLAGNADLANNPGDEIRRTWRALVAAAGAEINHYRSSWDEIEAELTEQGCWTAVYRAAHWKREGRPIELLERLRNRTFSHTWTVPDEVLASVHEQMCEWVKERYGSLEEPLPSASEFLVIASRWPGWSVAKNS